MKRDPRMVERKKTGLAKARKRVRQLFSMYTSHSSLGFFSTLGLSDDLQLFATFANIAFPFRISVLTVASMTDGGFMRENLAHNEKNDNV